MSDVYMMNVRADESPHEVLGQLPVPLAAAQGQMHVVGFRGRMSSQDYLTAKVTDVYLNVGVFVAPEWTNGREYALRVKRAEWPALKEKMFHDE